MSESPVSRRAFLTASLAGAAALSLGVLRLPAQAGQSSRKQLPAGIPREMVTYKDPNCGCCTEWVKHVEAAGFSVTMQDTRDMDAVKKSMGVTAALASCHTSRVGTYTVEGHVPADVIIRLLREKPAARGIAVPGMPIGSPGMEQGSRKDKYDVLLFDKAGKSRVYASR
jgi:hypothetical protein